MSFDLVLFGGTGDLTWRKLMPALFQAFRHGTLPAGGRIIGVGRDDLGAEQYRARIGARFFIDHGNGVVVGAGAKILGPIRIGDRARIAANSVVIEPVPAGATVVGIPGRVVAPQRSTTYGFDLDHHLIPDPVGKAIACLLDRVALLERTHLAASETNCATCDDACVEPIFSRPAYPSALQPSHSAHLE